MHTVIEATDTGFSHYWSELFANDPLQNPLYAQLANQDEKRVDRSQFTDRSFLVISEDKPVFGCSLTLHTDERGRRHVGYFGVEASTHVNSSSMSQASNNFRPEAIRLLQQHMSRLLEELRPDSLHYLDPVSCGIMSPVSQVLLEKGAQPTLYKAHIIDLNQSHLVLQRNVSKSFRGLINWGERNLRLELVNGRVLDGGDSGLLEAYQRSPGLQTESVLERWKIYNDLVQRGSAFLVQGHHREQLVGSALFVHTERSCHCVAGDTSPVAPDRPILHSMIWRAILHSKELGCAQFDLGHSSAGGDVEVTDHDFVKGFGGTEHTRLKIKLIQ